MPQTVALTPAEQQLAKVILRHAPNFAVKQGQRSAPLAAARGLAPYGVGLLSVGAALLVLTADNHGDQTPHGWLLAVAVCLAIKAAGVKAGRFAGGVSVVAYFALMVAPHSADWWQALHQPKLGHLIALVTAILLCTTPPGSYMRRMRRIIASITARISVSSASGLSNRLRSVSTS